MLSTTEHNTLSPRELTAEATRIIGDDGVSYRLQAEVLVASGEYASDDPRLAAYLDGSGGQATC